MQTKESTSRKERMYEYVEQWPLSGMGLKAYCVHINEKYGTFQYWRHKYRNEQASSADGFSEVKLALGAGTFIEVHYPTGTVVRLPQGTSVEVLLKLANL